MRIYRFGRFQLDSRRQVLLGGAGAEPVPLSGKLFNLLSCFIESGGRPLSKDELAARVWPGHEPSDATIVQHVMLLRKALGDNAKLREYIVTVAGRGYAFVPEVSCETPRLPARGHIGSDTSPSAWREYLAAEQYCFGGTSGSAAGLKQSLRHYKAALELDPKFEPAWTGVASMYCFLAFYGFVPWSAVLEPALNAVRTAIRLEPQSGLAHCLQAQLQFVQWDLSGALRLLEKSADLDPQSPHPYHLSAFIRRWCGEFDAAAADAKRSLAFDPSEVLTQGLYATALAGQGDYPNAIAIYSNVLEVHPSSETTRQARCDAYVASGEFHLALRDLEQMHRSPANLSRLGCVYSYSGDRLRAMTVLSQLQRRSVSEYVEPHCLAQLHIALGNHDEALKLANHAIKAHDLKFAGMLYSPLLAQSIRDRRLRARLSGIAAYLRKARKVAG